MFSIDNHFSSSSYGALSLTHLPETKKNVWAEAALCNAAAGIVHTGHAGITLAMHIQAIKHTLVH